MPIKNQKNTFEPKDKQCKYCRKKYARKASLIKHIHLQHPDEINYLYEGPTKISTKKLIYPILDKNSQENLNIIPEELDILEDIYYKETNIRINKSCKWQIIAAIKHLKKIYIK